MTFTKPRLLQGFRDHFGQSMELRQRILEAIKKAVSSYGFQPLETPALEYQEIIAPHSDQSEKLIYGFNDNGNRKVSLKYDLTVPTARFAAMNWEKLPRPFRRYQNQPVWRADRPGAGRYREFQQFDFDTYGSGSVFYDAEILLTLAECLNSINLGTFTIRLNDRRILTGVLESFGLEPEHHVAALRSLDKLDKIGSVGVHKEMEANNFDSKIIIQLLAFLAELDGLTNERLLARLERHFLVSRSTTGQAGVDAMATILGVITGRSITNSVIQLTPVLARGLDYYTGPIHEVVVQDASVGSICGGGRYDNLFENFSDKSIPATGTSLGIERIFDVLTSSSNVDIEPPAHVLICATDQVGMIAGLDLAARIRSAGLSVESYLDDSPLKKQLRYANQKQIPLVVLMPRVGDEDDKQVILKDMNTGEQEQFEPALLVGYITELLLSEIGGKK